MIALGLADKVIQREGSIAQTVAEGIEGRAVVLHVAVAATRGFHAVEQGELTHASGESDGELGRGVDLTEQDLGNGLCALLTGIPGLQNSFTAVDPVAHIHRRAVEQNHSRVGVCGGHTADAFLLIGLDIHLILTDDKGTVINLLLGCDTGETDVGTVHTLALHYSGHVQRGIALCGDLLDTLVFSEDHLGIAVQVLTQVFQRSLGICGLPIVLVGTGIVFAHRKNGSTRTEHGQGLDLASLEGEQTVIFQQNHRAAGGFKSQLLVLVATDQSICRLGIGKGFIHQTHGKLGSQHAKNGAVNIGLGDPALVVGGQEFFIGAKGEIDVQTRLEAESLGLPMGIHHLMCIIYSLNTAVVRDDKALEAPLVSQDLGKHTLVTGAGDTLPAIVSGHDRQGPALLEALFKGLQVDLTHGALRGVGHVGIAAAVRVVVGVVLGGSNNTILLQTATDRHTHIGGKQYILTEGLHGTAPTAVADNVDNRCQRLANTHHSDLLTDSVADPGNHFIIKGRSHTNGLGEAGTHTPLCAVQSLAMLQGGNSIGMSIHGQLNIPIDTLGNLCGSCGLGLILMHEVTGVTGISLFVIALLFVIILNIEKHLTGELVELFLKGHTCEQIRSTLGVVLFNHSISPLIIFVIQNKNKPVWLNQFLFRDVGSVYFDCFVMVTVMVPREDISFSMDPLVM